MMKRAFLWIFAVGALLTPGSGFAALPFDLSKLSRGTESAPTETKKTPEASEILQLREATVAETLAIERELQVSTGLSDLETQFLEAKLQALQRQSVLYDELIDSLASLKKVQTRIEESEVPLKEWRSGTPPKNFTADFATLDKLRGQSVESQKSQGSREDIYKSRIKALEDAKANFREAEGKRRQAKEEAETAKPDEKQELEKSLLLAQLRSRNAEIQLQLRETELDVSKHYRELSNRQAEIGAYQTEYLEKHVRLDKSVLDRELDQLRAEESKLQTLLEKSRKALGPAETEYARTRRALDATTDPSPALVEEAEARRLELNFLGQEIEFITQRLHVIKQLETSWKQRFALLTGKVDRNEIRLWQDETQQTLDQISRDEGLLSLRLSGNRSTLSETQNKLASRMDADAETKRWMGRQEEILQHTIALLQEYQSAMLQVKKFEEKFLYEQQEQYAHVTFKERMRRIWDGFLRVWNFEVTSVDDSPITVGKIVVALILVLFGTLLARRISRLIADRILPRFGVSSGVAAALKTLSFYLLFLFFFIFALNVVKVPLTLFAVLGGAVAIGIGFGSQNLMNNFISGLILLIERPIKVGDIVQTDGITGTVEHIGGRSTAIRTADNTHFIVPNSSFLEKPVTNWTLTDDMIRSVVRIGVAYGTPPRQVADQLRKIVDSHGKILKTPKPMVVFSDFGGDALIFDLLFWVKLRAVGDRRELESDLRFMIASAFEEAGIEIPFAQRDLHLKSSAPLEIKISDPSPK